jgi:hypothetical protein
MSYLRESSFVILALPLVLVSPAWPDTLLVPDQYATIGEALQAAQSGDEVVISCGTYFEHDLQLVTGVTVRSETGEPDCVTIDAQGQGRLFVAGRDSSVTLEGVTLTGGLADYGGALMVDETEVSLFRCNLFENEAGYRGGGVLVLDGSIRAEECVFGLNRVINTCWTCRGGGISLRNSTAELVRSTIAHNTVHRYGGAIDAWQYSSISLERCVVAQNSPQNFSFMGATQLSSTCCVFLPDGLNGQGNIVADPLFCDPEGWDFRVGSGSPCLPGHNSCYGLIGPLGHGCGPVEPREYIVTSDPPGLPIEVDGVSWITPATFQWLQYSEHPVVAAPVGIELGTRWGFRAWSDSGAAAHTLIAPAEDHVFTATYAYEHWLFVPIPRIGTVNPGSGWHEEGSSVVLEAVPDPGFYFLRWEGVGDGSYTGTDNPITVTMNEPLRQTAHFGGKAYEFTISASDSDPYENEDAPTYGVRPLYFWLTCSRGGVAALEASVVGSLPVAGFTGANGVLNAGTAQHLLLAVPGCPKGEDINFLLGWWIVWDDGGDLCLDRNLSGENSRGYGVVDCAITTYTPQPGVTGFSSSGAPPCYQGNHDCGTRRVAPVQIPSGAATGPHKLALLPNRPNPFSQATEIQFAIPLAGLARLVIYDVTGRRVHDFGTRVYPAGVHMVSWGGEGMNSRAVPAGIYFLRLETQSETRTQKLVRLSP